MTAICVWTLKAQATTRDSPSAMRIPGWSLLDGGQPKLRVNGRPVPVETQLGFATIERTWKDGDRIRSGAAHAGTAGADQCVSSRRRGTGARAAGVVRAGAATEAEPQSAIEREACGPTAIGRPVVRAASRRSRRSTMHPHYTAYIRLCVTLSGVEACATLSGVGAPIRCDISRHSAA